MGLADIVDEDGDVEGVGLLGQGAVVGLGGRGEVDRDDVCLDLVGLRDFGGERVQLRLGAGDEEDVVPGFGELARELLADAVGGAGDDRPAPLGPELSELGLQLVHIQVAQALGYSRRFRAE